jgi:threonine/homoserine/homoserine lactone efflux protein
MEFLSLAFTCGISAGLSPGPLMTVIIAESIKHGRKEGIKVAMAPLFTDIPIVAFVLLVLSKLSHIDPVLGTLSLMGSVYLLYLGLCNLRFTGMNITLETINPQSFRKGIITNLLSPSPYMFWFTVLGISLIDAYHRHWLLAVLFVVIFYCLLLGSKFVIAILAAESRRFLSSCGFIYTFRFLGLLLWICALLLLQKSLILFGIWSQHVA